jgi:MFS family permease
MNGTHQVTSSVDVAHSVQGLGWLPPCLPNFNNLAWGGAVAAFLVGALFGTLFATRLASAFGRKWTLVLMDLVTAPGYLFVFFATNIWLFFIGRLLMGIGGGASVSVTTIYLGEVAPVRTRGAIAATFHLSSTSGMLVAMLLGYFMSTPKLWRILLIIGVFFSIFQVAMMPFAIESPRWLVFKGKFMAAKRALRKLRGMESGESTKEVDKEFADLLDGLGVKNQVQDAARAWFEEEMKDMSEKKPLAPADGWGEVPLSRTPSPEKPATTLPRKGTGELDDRNLFTDIEEDIGLGPEDDELFGLNHQAFEDDDDEDDDDRSRPSQDSANYDTDDSGLDTRRSNSFRRRFLNNGVGSSVMSILELIRTKSLRKHAFLAAMLQFSMPLCGVTTINMYSSTIFARSFPQSTSLILTAMIGPIMLISSLVAIPLVDNMGRKPLLIISFAGMLMCCIGMSIAGPFTGVAKVSAAEMAAMSHGHRAFSRREWNLDYAVFGIEDDRHRPTEYGLLPIKRRKLTSRQVGEDDFPDPDEDEGNDEGDDVLSDSDEDGILDADESFETGPDMDNNDLKPGNTTHPQSLADISITKTVTNPGVMEAHSKNMIAASAFVAFSYIFVAFFSSGLGAISGMMLAERESNAGIKMFKSLIFLFSSDSHSSSCRYVGISSGRRYSLGVFHLGLFPGSGGLRSVV